MIKFLCFVSYLLQFSTYPKLLYTKFLQMLWQFRRTFCSSSSGWRVIASEASPLFCPPPNLSLNFSALHKPAVVLSEADVVDVDRCWGWRGFQEVDLLDLLYLPRAPEAGLQQGVRPSRENHRSSSPPQLPSSQVVPGSSFLVLRFNGGLGGLGRRARTSRTSRWSFQERRKV